MMRAVALTLCASLAACAHPAMEVPDGATVRQVRVDAEPTPAWIFVDGAYVGRTPVKSAVSFTHATRFIEVVAVPLHDSQTRQVLRIVPPSLPRDLRFFLDNQDPRAVAR